MDQILASEISSVVLAVRIDPGRQTNPIFQRHFHLVMTGIQQFDQAAGVGAELVGRKVMVVSRLRMVFSDYGKARESGEA